MLVDVQLIVFLSDYHGHIADWHKDEIFKKEPHVLVIVKSHTFGERDYFGLISLFQLNFLRKVVRLKAFESHLLIENGDMIIFLSIDLSRRSKKDIDI
jgi:hypothetical protein